MSFAKVIMISSSDSTLIILQVQWRSLFSICEISDLVQESKKMNFSC